MPAERQKRSRSPSALLGGGSRSLEDHKALIRAYVEVVWNHLTGCAPWILVMAHWHLRVTAPVSLLWALQNTRERVRMPPLAARRCVALGLRRRHRCPGPSRRHPALAASDCFATWIDEATGPTALQHANRGRSSSVCPAHTSFGWSDAALPGSVVVHDIGDRCLKTSATRAGRFRDGGRWSGCSARSKARLVLTALFVDRQTPAEVARRYAVHRSWVYRLRARYRAEGRRRSRRSRSDMRSEKPPARRSATPASPTMASTSSTRVRGMALLAASAAG